MIFALLTLFTALALASVSGWFSIVGFMAIYAGAPMYALIMGVVTELAKLVTTSWIYRNWQYSDWKLKVPLLYFTLALMTATSIGVFGFLSKAHLEQGAGTMDNSAKISTLNYQIDREKSIIADNEKVIAQLDGTVNSLLGKDRADRSLSVRKSQATQRKQLRADIDAAQKKIDELGSQKFTLESEIRKMELEVGPIRYIAELFYGVEEDSTKNIESAVRIFILLIVSTLDPLAVILLIAANHTLLRLRNEKEERKAAANNGSGVREVVRPDTNINYFPSQEIDQDKTELSEVQLSTLDKLPATDRREVSLSSEIPKEALDSINEEVPPQEIDTNMQSILPIALESEKIDQFPEVTEVSAEVEKSTEIPKVNHEEIKAALERFSSAGKGTPPAIVRQPSLTRVSRPGTDEITKNAPTMGNKVQEEQNVTQSVKPWAQQEQILIELLGSGQHFTPQKVVNKKIENVDDDVPEPDKYPRAPLSWLSEFKRT